MKILICLFTLGALFCGCSKDEEDKSLSVECRVTSNSSWRITWDGGERTGTQNANFQVSVQDNNVCVHGHTVGNMTIALAPEGRNANPSNTASGTGSNVQACYP